MKNRLYTFAFLTLALLIQGPALIAQKSISDIAELSDKKWSKFVHTSMNDYWLEGLVSTNLLDADKTPQPKRIGILTVQLYSLGSESSMRAGDWVTTTKYSSTAEGQAFFVDQMMAIIVPEMTQVFGNAGYELLEPSAYLDTPEKHEIYKTGKSTIETSGLTKLAAGKLEAGADYNFSGEVPAGYEWYPVSPTALSMDTKGPPAYGLLAEKLGLDGLLIFSLTTVTSKKYVSLDKFNAAIVGPVDDNKDAEYKGRINSGSMNRARDGIYYAYAGF
ncbi:MAG: hypothetical protein ABR574_07765 [Cryomorphaceae bacterium]|nr:hypothetical protein [Flavobacteriales bacterium]